ncbi:hypothetical protein A1O3_03158 [Capronia epimyces CBS 606.96]|uniref:EthD domain-containing protein n=1 Tax=Capronia epimyces CBS 606.96 TaxID=1182542 RepID=W9Z6G5_9EURO|nr:uncharacterized protein A1O3_03158 [Capronia epimyces CBS 606.96]EXJ90089.1 hypothetical protein A1O3_03158 [Capronia epimyces CBS 606.96]
MAFRITLLIKKLDTLTHDDWEGPHAELFLKCPIVKEKVIKYSQFHINQTVSASLTAAGLPMSEFDGEVNIWGASLEDLMAMLQDPEYQRTVVPDGAVFIKTEDSRMMVGYDKDFIANGKVL